MSSSRGRDSTGKAWIGMETPRENEVQHHLSHATVALAVQLRGHRKGHECHSG